MKDITYRCDLCKDSFDITELVGLKFSGNDTIVYDHPVFTERHFCIKCCMELYKFLISLKEDPKFVNMKKEFDGV
jgi:hypothetical protein